MTDENRTAWRHDLGKVLETGLSALADLVYPPICAGCGGRLSRHRSICPSCWASMRFIERPYCPVLGIPFSHDLGAGMLSAEAIANPPDFDRLRAVALHDGVVRRLVHGLKYQDRSEHVQMMAAWMVRASEGLVNSADLVIPVPLHRWRLLSRRFNQSAELARAIAHLTGRSLDVDSLQRIRATRHQVGLGETARETNVRGAFAVTGEGRARLFGKRVVLVDDVYTTGATVNAVSRALRKAGVADITVLTFAMALHEPI